MKKNLILALLLILVIILCWFLYRYMQSRAEPEAEQPEQTQQDQQPQQPQKQGYEDEEFETFEVDYSALEIPFFESSLSHETVSHLGYTTCYCNETKIPSWVAYRLDRSDLAGDISRSDNFVCDPGVKGPQATTYDYKGSGYDRGHMAPAADMKWSSQAMIESFYMSNMCPQAGNLNRGDWKRLEELCRDLTERYDKIYVVCGPVGRDTLGTIGPGKVHVPAAFFKTLLVETGDRQFSAIGFYFENKSATIPLSKRALSIDSLEVLTGIDFYPSLPDIVERPTEASFTLRDWNL
ncbi:MAG: DNA/RNA non-specific endonuclease [Bacteroidales bacterium]|nr:DNA/RNA non-specific endonuclease [Bacteroidales bacterium]